MRGRSLHTAALGAAIAIIAVVAPAVRARCGAARRRARRPSGVTVIVDFTHFGGDIERGLRARPTRRPRSPRCTPPASTTAGTAQYGDAFVCRIDGLPAPKHEACADHAARERRRGRSATRARPTRRGRTPPRRRVELPAAAGHDRCVRVRQPTRSRASRPSAAIRPTDDRRPRPPTTTAHHRHHPVTAPTVPPTVTTPTVAPPTTTHAPPSAAVDADAHDHRHRSTSTTSAVDDRPRTSTARIVDRTATGDRPRTTAPGRRCRRSSRVVIVVAPRGGRGRRRSAPAGAGRHERDAGSAASFAALPHPAHRPPDRVVDLGDRARDRREPHDQPAAARARSSRVAGIVVAARRTEAPWARAFKCYLLLGVVGDRDPRRVPHRARRRRSAPASTCCSRSRRSRCPGSWRACDSAAR